jgi:hypothetical protein
MPPADRRITTEGDSAGLDATAERFRDAWFQPDDDPAAPNALLPTRLIHAVLKVLPADGAGLSLFNDDFRVPLATTDMHAHAAERLQFTLGEGPCLTAAESHVLLAAGSQELSQRWPVYADELESKTPYRAVITLPFALGTARGAIDLYLADAAKLRDFGLADAAVVADATADALRHGRDDPAPAAGQAPMDWLAVSPARERLAVWVAIGIVMVKADVIAVDALDLLRSYAYARGGSLDEVSAALSAGDLDPAELQN